MPTITPATGGPRVQDAARTRPMRTERLVTLRSAMPLQLMTLRHAMPMHLRGIDASALTSTTPKVEDAPVLETTAGKGGEAR